MFDVASSNIIIFDFLNIARQIQIIYLSPADKLTPPSLIYNVEHDVNYSDLYSNLSSPDFYTSFSIVSSVSLFSGSILNFREPLKRVAS